MADDLQRSLNRLAGTTGLDAQGAANVWAGTTQKDLLGALNAKAGTTGVGLNAVCNLIAGTTGLDAQGALAAASGTSFDPVAALTWTGAYWASGPEFAALGVADGGAVATLPDEKSTRDLTQGTEANKPTYRATGGSNSKPTLEFDGSGDMVGRGSTPTMSYPFSTVAIAKSDYVGVNQKVLWGGEAAIGALWQQGSEWRLYSGTVLDQTAVSDTNWHLFVAYYNNTASKLDVDGVEVLSGAAGNTAYAGAGLGHFALAAGTWDGFASFYGLAAGDIRNDSGWSGFKTWVTSYYGITVA